MCHPLLQDIFKIDFILNRGISAINSLLKTSEEEINFSKDALDVCYFNDLPIEKNINYLNKIDNYFIKSDINKIC